jgi:hypothetical protein
MMRPHLRVVDRPERPNGDGPTKLQHAEARVTPARVKRDGTTYGLVLLVMLITGTWVVFLGWLLVKFAGLSQS